MSRAIVQSVPSIPETLKCNSRHCGPVPLIVGVSGHRDLDAAHLDGLRGRVRQVLTELKQACPHTSLVVISPLVEGADQLVAEIALEPEFGAELIAVLPWSQGILPDCLPRGGDRECFDAMLKRAKHVIALPLPSGVDAARLAVDETARLDQYAQVGAYVARHSQALIALWDGCESDESGTTRTIRWQRDGAPAPYAARVGELDTVEGAAVYHIVSPRTGWPAPTGGLAIRHIFPVRSEISWTPKPPKGLLQQLGRRVRTTLVAVHHLLESRQHDADSGIPIGERDIRRRWRSIDRFNQDAFQISQSSPQDLARNRGWLIPDELVESLPDPVARLREVYALADTASMQCQTRTTRMVQLLFVLGFSAIGLLEIYAHFWHEWPLLLIYLTLLGGGFFLFRRSRQRDEQGRWLDYRALAEALRVQVFWRWAGLTDSAGDYYLRHFRGELDWIRHAVRACYLASGGHSPDTKDSVESGCRGALQYWIDDQEGFFRKKAPDNNELDISFETAAQLAFFAAVGLAVVHLVWHFLTGHESHALILGTFLALVTAAFIEEYADFRTYAILGRKYRWMTNLYATAHKRLRHFIATGNWQRAHCVFFDLGCEALAENADWVVQHRQHPPTLPRG